MAGAQKDSRHLLAQPEPVTSGAGPGANLFLHLFFLGFFLGGGFFVFIFASFNVCKS